uniref:Uncharacterized protein AlNc14C199G8635 n=1 Tax=Albugo laibachii Nc14 TaxID=890382 RepID=F0WQG4_9STRA|nr:conserved unknown protein putative [Albugo laibachii Nc14]|eukprot:CCA23573.1 conserved unknown protein putative [Albugo laibachii Nc14]
MSSNTTYQTPEAKKEEFRKYLEKSGVVDALTKVLVGLYEVNDKPSNAVDYLKRFLGAPTGVDIDALRAENEELKKKNAELIQTIEELNKRVRDDAADPCDVLMRIVFVRLHYSYYPMKRMPANQTTPAIWQVELSRRMRGRSILSLSKSVFCDLK